MAFGELLQRVGDVVTVGRADIGIGGGTVSEDERKHLTVNDDALRRNICVVDEMARAEAGECRNPESSPALSICCRRRERFNPSCIEDGDVRHRVGITRIVVLATQLTFLLAARLIRAATSS